MSNAQNKKDGVDPPKNPSKSSNIPNPGDSTPNSGTPKVRTPNSSTPKVRTPNTSTSKVHTPNVTPSDPTPNKSTPKERNQVKSVPKVKIPKEPTQDANTTGRRVRDLSKASAQKGPDPTQSGNTTTMGSNATSVDPLLKKSARFKKVKTPLNLQNISFTKIEAPVEIKDPEEKVKKVLISNEDEQSRILASFVPDEIIYDHETSGIRTYDVALLLGDVSGFTDLCEKYNKTGRGGPSRLTEILNGYIGSMVQEIMSGYGDVLNFSGDAFLAWWKTSQERSMQDVVGLAIDCAIMIQKNYGSYETDIGVTLRVKVGIAAGTILFSVIGTDKLKYFIIVGRPIFDVKLSEHLCTKGDVMVSPHAWKYIQQNIYIYDDMPDGLHKKIRGAAPWKRMQMGGFGPLDMGMVTNSEQELSRFSNSKTEFSENQQTGRLRNDDYLLRPSVNEAARQTLKEPLRPYIFPPVMKGIDMNEPLEYLTEMRHVVIMFVNVITANPDMYRLVSLVDEAYCTVCTFVDEYRGSVNKCSMFDKDLMFLVVYGLRGYKHDLESQSGLRCAAEVYKALTNISDIAIVSIGVTTGMTYCGAVGHAMRREYTVIGNPVNKAARLMIAYPSRVTCDRETFLQSQLEARHFSLQEAKELKGLGTVGPIYEYLAAAKPRSREKHIVCKYPLLDREKEMLMFKNYLDRLVRCIQQSDSTKEDDTKSDTGRQQIVTAIIIQGQPRQGKSRLLDEMVYSTDPNSIQIRRIALSYLDKRVPYSCIQLIFAPVLGFSENFSMRDKEDTIVNRLKGKADPEMLCCLNYVFKVAFPASEKYFGRPTKMQDQILSSVFKELARRCFREMVWVIAIDDCEFVDEDSWKLLQVLTEGELVFIIMTLGLRRDVNEIAQRLLQSSRVRKIVLDPIRKNYHAGLACQMLEVKAIPPELEKEIHDQSHGSPGWVESYLVSLLQAGGISMTSIPRETVTAMGLVVAMPEQIARRQQPADTDKSKGKNRPDSNLSLDLTLNDGDDLEERKDDGWPMYRFTYDDSVTRMLNRRKEQTQRKLRPEVQRTVEVVVCVLTPSFSMSSLTAELTMDVLVIKIFDSLTSFQQMILKNASVLGEVFTRKMLRALMAETDSRAIALGIKHLFEIQVIGCAEGNFENASTFMSQQRRPNITTMDQAIKCKCKGVFVPSSCKDLPAYASCGYMRFRTVVFKETIYHLLTNVQKKDANMRAAKYLGRETRRCEACGGGRFQNILGNRMDDKKRANRTTQSKSLNEELMMKMPSITTRDPLPTWLHPDGIVGGPAFLRITREDMVLAKYYRPSTSTQMLDTIPEIQRQQSQEKHAKQKNEKALLARQRLRHIGDKNEVSLTHTFSGVSFTECECSLILITLYTMLLEHCRRAEDTATLIDALLEYAAVCIACSNIPQMMRLLDEANSLLEKTAIEEDKDNIIPAWKYPFVMGRIHTLLGYSHLVLNQIDLAYKRLYLAMEEFSEPFPVASVPAFFHTRYNKTKLRILLRYQPQFYVGHLSGFKAAIAEHMAECLSLLCLVFQNKRQWKLAYLAAAWGLNVSLQTKHDFFGLCAAFCNMLNVANHYSDEHMSWTLEVAALTLCNLTTCTVAKELEAIVRLYYSVFLSRLNRGEIPHAGNLGLKVLHISSTTQSSTVYRTLLPTLILTMVMERRINQAVVLLHTLELVGHGEHDKSAIAWFLALSMRVQLETGFRVVTIEQIEAFLLEEGEVLTSVRDRAAKTRFYINSWLWCLRNNEWEAADIWRPLALQDYLQHTDDSMAAVFSSVNLLEGLLMIVVGRVDVRDVKTVATKFKEIRKLMDRIGAACKSVKMAVPRFLHMKAYYHQIRYQDKSGMKILSQGKKIAQEQGNLMEWLWMDHSQKSWNGTLPPFLMNLWIDRCDPNNALDWHDIGDNEEKLSPYTLPLPKYINRV